jgi:hypothetical protein
MEHGKKVMLFAIVMDDFEQVMISRRKNGGIQIKTTERLPVYEAALQLPSCLPAELPRHQQRRLMEHYLLPAEIALREAVFDYSFPTTSDTAATPAAPAEDEATPSTD